MSYNNGDMIASRYAEKSLLGEISIKTDEDIFRIYEEVREKGIYNMILNCQEVMRVTGLKPHEYFKVIENYDEMKRRYK